MPICKMLSIIRLVQPKGAVRVIIATDGRGESVIPASISRQEFTYANAIQIVFVIARDA